MNNEERRFTAAVAAMKTLGLAFYTDQGMARVVGEKAKEAGIGPDEAIIRGAVEMADQLLAELDRTKPEPEPEESQPFRIAFLELASDLKPRTVKQIRESLNLPESSNVGESLRSLQACLAGDETAVVRLRSKKSQSRSHSAIWWLERK